MTRQPLTIAPLTRRGFLAASGSTTANAPTGSGSSGGIAAAEAVRPRTGKIVTAHLTPGAADVDLGGTGAPTLGYDNQLPGRLLRANVGDEIAVTVDNGLDHITSMHQTVPLAIHQGQHATLTSTTRR